MKSNLKKTLAFERLITMSKSDIAEQILKVYDQKYKASREIIGRTLMEDNKKSGLIKIYMSMMESDDPSSYIDQTPVAPVPPSIKWTNIL
jgi:hypothetical protein